MQWAIEDGMRRIVRCGKALASSRRMKPRRYIEPGSLFTADGQDLVLLARESEKLACRFKA